MYPSFNLNNEYLSAEILNAHDLRIFYLLKIISLYKHRTNSGKSKVKNKSPKMLTSDQVFSSCTETCSFRWERKASL